MPPPTITIFLVCILVALFSPNQLSKPPAHNPLRNLQPKTALEEHSANWHTYGAEIVRGNPADGERAVPPANRL